MSDTDSTFAGSIPAVYGRFLGPLLFEPYASNSRAAIRAAERLPARRSAPGPAHSACREP